MRYFSTLYVKLSGFLGIRQHLELLQFWRYTVLFATIWMVLFPYYPLIPCIINPRIYSWTAYTKKPIPSVQGNFSFSNL